MLGLRTYPVGGAAAPPYTNGPYRWTLETSNADVNMLDFRFTNSATSGDNRGLYNRFYLSGAGGGGESLRSFTTVSDVAAGTAHGAHVSLNFATSGSVTGLGVATRTTLHVIDGALTGGTYAAFQPEVWADGDGSDVSGATTFAILRPSLGGDDTGVANIDANAYLIDFAGFTAGSGNMLDTDITALTGKAGIRVAIDGVAYGYIPVVTGS